MAMTMLEVIQQEGIAEGRAEGQVKTLITVLEARFGEIPATLRNKLLKVRSDEQIATLSKLVGTCQSLTEFQKAL
jgi:hypothetical protein